MNRRTVIIGLDGVPYNLLKSFADGDIMPHTKGLISKGILRKMQSSIPEISSVAWSSIITGANPAEHGIFGFTDFPPHTYRLTYPNFNNLKSHPFWNKKKGGKSIVINVPSTYPARELNGIMISGFVALDLERAVFPASLIPDLQCMEYKVDADLDKGHQSLELFIKDLKRTNEARISAYRLLWNYEWDTFMLVFTGTDRLMHFLWDAYENVSHSFHKEFIDYFRRIDEIIGEIIFKMNDNDNLVILSDHGFEKLEYDVYINALLKKEGFLQFKNDKTISFSSINYGTKAFALDPARIYIHLKDKYPRGDVSYDDRENVIKDLERLFMDFTIHNRKVIKHVYRKEEIYKGPYFDHAPDLVLIGNKGFNLKAAINAENICSKGIFTGKHTQDDAFLLVNKKCSDEIIPDNVNVSDVIRIMDQL